MNVQSKKEVEGKVFLIYDTYMMRIVIECFIVKFVVKRCLNNMGKLSVCFIFFLILERYDRNRNCKRKEIYVRLIQIK